MKFRDLPAAKFGRYGEQIVGRLLRSKGAGVIATFKFSGENDNEAPALEFDDRRTVLADFDVSLKGKTFSVEAKTYERAAWNHKRKCLVHGIPTRLFDEYCATEKQRGIPVFLGVLEVDTGAFIISKQPVSQLEKWPCQCGCVGEPEQCDFRDKWGSSYPQWYFRRDLFEEWSRLADHDLADLQRAHGRVSHALRRHRDNEPSPQEFVAYPKNGQAWTFACLSCNWTGGDVRHRCNPQGFIRDYWTRTLRFAGVPKQDAETLVGAPVNRQRLVEILGQQWSPEADFR